MKKIIMWVFLGLSISVCAEYRIWRDKKGNSLEAELVTVNATMVAVRDRNGKTYKFAPDKLSKADQTYLRTAFPPKMEIEFKKNQDRRNSSWASSNVNMYGEVTVTKKEQRPYDKNLTVTLLIIGESQRYRDFIVMDRSESKFNFKSSREYVLEGGSFEMHQDKYDNSWGVKYEGFLVVIQDAAGKIIEVKSSKKDYEANPKKILAFKKGERFDRKFKKSAASGSSSGTLYY